MKMMSVKQMLEEGRLKEGMKLELKSLKDAKEIGGCFNDAGKMDKFFGERVTYKGKSWGTDISIEEDQKLNRGMAFTWQIEWFKDFDIFKDALEKSIMVWQYMVDKRCFKSRAIEELLGETKVLYSCYLCDVLREGDEKKLKGCERCISWIDRKGRDDSIPAKTPCLSGDSPFREYTFKQGSPKDVLNLLKSEYERLYPKVQETKIVKEEAKEKKQAHSYQFRDTNINFHKLCLDALEDKKTGFIVEGKDIAYIGILHNSIDFKTTLMLRGISPMDVQPNLPYYIFKIRTELTSFWQDQLRAHTLREKTYAKELDTLIKDRSRTKGHNQFKVTQY